ncbi:MAG: hypothetical protein KDB40_22605 [Acidimicrobiales bacterium]|nr:hypothetical protein [Acidimicrobiales bacterium]MCB9395510.1 hypothetical protein [Acidimicrobiaceae bacterium]
MQIPPPACAVLAPRTSVPSSATVRAWCEAITAVPCHQPLVFDARRVGTLDPDGATSLVHHLYWKVRWAPVVIVAAASAAWPRLLHLDRSVPVVDDLDRAITLAGGPAATVRSAA